ncbi:MAG: (d)CMP kinase [Candidatus Gracilibacteria bacterium]|nr:(d)CMP kinase [Candidatus Gracilibacteria bacterium]
MPLKISISGLAGSGKSSLVKEIVARTGFATADVGQLYRARAFEKGMTITEYDKFIEKNPEEDIAMDNNFKELVENCQKDIIVSWRIGFHFVPDIISIWLDVSPEEGAKRIMLDDGRGGQEKKYSSLEEAIKTNEDRMERVRQRLKLLYGIDFMNKSNYTKVIDTTGKGFEEVLGEVMEYIEECKII